VHRLVVREGTIFSTVTIHAQLQRPIGTDVPLEAPLKEQGMVGRRKVLEPIALHQDIKTVAPPLHQHRSSTV